MTTEGLVLFRGVVTTAGIVVFGSRNAPCEGVLVVSDACKPNPNAPCEGVGDVEIICAKEPVTKKLTVILTAK